jgi:hypothetical protein
MRACTRQGDRAEASRSTATAGRNRKSSTGRRTSAGRRADGHAVAPRYDLHSRHEDVLGRVRVSHLRDPLWESAGLSDRTLLRPTRLEGRDPAHPDPAPCATALGRCQACGSFQRAHLERRRSVVGVGFTAGLDRSQAGCCSSRVRSRKPTSEPSLITRQSRIAGIPSDRLRVPIWMLQGGPNQHDQSFRSSPRRAGWGQLRAADRHEAHPGHLARRRA